jgi:uncharacterized protein YbjT (DUF2867 family)
MPVGQPPGPTAGQPFGQPTGTIPGSPGGAVVVFGATGEVGRATVRALHARGQHVTAVSRDPQRARGVLPPDVPVVRADLRDPATVAAAVRGARAVLVQSPAGPDQDQLQATLVDAAVAAGVRRLVKVSALAATVRPDSGSHVGQLHYATETRIRQSAVPWTFVRPTPFQQVLRESPDVAVRGSRMLLPFGNARVAFVDAADVGAVCAAALVESGAECHVYDVTGPEALALRDVARLLACTCQGRPLHYRSVSPTAAASAQRQRGVEVWLAEHQAEVGKLIAEGAAAAVTSTVADVTGRPARRLVDLLLAPSAA